MTQHYPLMITGAASNTVPLEVRAPYDQDLIATIDVGGEVAVEKALSTAYGLFRDRDAWLSPARRIEILRNAARLMQEQAEHLATEAAREGGKPLVDSRVEVVRAIDGVVNCAEVLRSEAGHVIPMSINAGSMGRIAFTQREPIGVVVAVSAFNHPLNLIVHQVGPAIAAGCPVIVKPAGDTPLSCFRFVEILQKSGLPKAWCQALVTESNDLTTRLVTDRRVGFFSFIGSAHVGWMLRSRLAPGTRCALEHGGVAPVIIAADADLDAALPKLIKGGFYHAGQVCVSVQRIFAHRSIVDQVAEGLGKLATQLRVGDPLSADTEVGPLIRQQEVRRVDEWIHEAAEAGAKLICGGTVLSPSCYAPTVLVEPPASCRVSREEVFGPVVCVYAFDDFDQAIALANSLPVAFQAAVFTRAYATAMRAYSRLDASAVMLNDHTAFRVDWMPFAGLRVSGFGVGGIPYTFHDMQIEKLFVGPMATTFSNKRV
jgi:acyl-CoA reductase-like NAD-dependent aldehyde dehydrogenase